MKRIKIELTEDQARLTRLLLEAEADRFTNKKSDSAFLRRIANKLKAELVKL